MKIHNDNSLAMSSARAQTVISKSHSPSKGRVWWDDSILAKEVYQMSLGYLVEHERK